MKSMEMMDSVSKIHRIVSFCRLDGFVVLGLAKFNELNLCPIVNLLTLTEDISNACHLSIYSFQVGRAFSFNKTPSKMKRAVSSMMSPR